MSVRKRPPVTSRPGSRPAAGPPPRPRPGSAGARAAEQVASFFKTLGDPTRVRILAALGRGELCVHELCARLGMQQPAVSHQLRVLRDAHVVRARRDGREVIYHVEDPRIAALVAGARAAVRPARH